eukprot:SAG31_NODE_702_length_12723_cov_4.100206_1_plen_290_part_10
MATNPNFKWNHECILFVRAFIEFFPEREAEMVRFMANGQLDFGGTFSQPLEQTLYNEVLIRQMYEGRKWFVERYPEVDSARTAFQQDAPAKALQSFQIYNRSGIKFLKASRLGDEIFNWASPDGSTTLAFEQLDYAESSGASADKIFEIMTSWLPQFLDSGAPPLLPVASGSDYTSPATLSQLQSSWNTTAFSAFGKSPPPLVYSHVHEYLQKLQDSPTFKPRTFRGERPNLCVPTVLRKIAGHFVILLHVHTAGGLQSRAGAITGCSRRSEKLVGCCRLQRLSPLFER